MLYGLLFSQSKPYLAIRTTYEAFFLECRAIFDVDLLGFNFLIMDTCGDQLQHHHYAILCFLLPVCSYTTSFETDLHAYKEDCKKHADINHPSFQKLESLHVLLFCWQPSRVFCLYANRAALNMLETKLDNLQTLTMDRILGGSKNLSLEAILPNLQRQVCFWMILTHHIRWPFWITMWALAVCRGIVCYKLDDACLWRKGAFHMDVAWHG